MVTRKKATIFWPYLAPWRIDVFNEMAKHYDLTVVFFNPDTEGFVYNSADLLSRLKNVKTYYLTKGFAIGNHVPFRFGVLKMLCKTRPDIVFVHEYSPTSALLVLYRQLRLFKYKLYVTTSDNLKMAQASSGLKAWSRSFVLRHCNGAIVYSKIVKEWYQATFPFLSVEICPNIQRPQTLLAYREQFAPIIQRYKEQYGLENKKVILFTGRLVPVKGVDLLLKAFSKIDRENCKLVLVGQGIQKQEYQDLARQLGIEADTIFAGFYKGAELYAWYDLANFFVLPSRYEPFGAVINEALVYGCPVVASQYIGALDFINADNGIIFDPLQEDDFERVLNTALDKFGRRSASRSNLMPFSFEQYVSVFWQMPEEANR